MTRITVTRTATTRTAATRTARPLLAALALALLAGTAAAQAPPPGGPRPPAPPAVEVAPPPSALPRADASRADGPNTGPRTPMGPMGPGRAAHLRFEHGNVDIDVKCADDEGTKACVDAIMPLVERLSQMQNGYNESPRYR